MRYVKTVNPVTADGRKRSLSVGYAIRELDLNVGDRVLAYLVRPEDEFEFDTLLNGRGKQYYIVFSDRTDIIAADTLAHAERIAKESYDDPVVIGGMDTRAQAIRFRNILLEEDVPKERMQRRLEELLLKERSPCP